MLICLQIRTHRSSFHTGSTVLSSFHCLLQKTNICFLKHRATQSPGSYWLCINPSTAKKLFFRLVHIIELSFFSFFLRFQLQFGISSESEEEEEEEQEAKAGSLLPSPPPPEDQLRHGRRRRTEKPIPEVSQPTRQIRRQKSLAAILGTTRERERNRQRKKSRKIDTTHKYKNIPSFT